MVVALHLLEVVVIGEGRAARISGLVCLHLLRVPWPTPFSWARSSLTSSLLLALFLARLSAGLCCGVLWSASSSFSWARSSLTSSLCRTGALRSLLLGPLLRQLLCLFFFAAVRVAAPACAVAAPLADAAPLAGRHGSNGGQQRPGSKAACKKGDVGMRLNARLFCVQCLLSST